MIRDVIKRLEVVAGIEEARGISDDTWNTMNSAEKKKYIEEHPTCRFVKKQNKKKKLEKNCFIKDPVVLDRMFKKIPHKVNIDGTVDIYGDMKASYVRNFVKDGRFKVRFGTVNGIFRCPSNLISLEGSPHTVNGSFHAWHMDNLKDLKGSPKKVNGGYGVSGKNIRSLVGAPREVTDTFSFGGSDKITLLDGAPDKVGYFMCEDCKNLKSLIGCPQQIEENLDIRNCPNLTSLKGAPKIIGKNLVLIGCDNLISTVGSPEKLEHVFCDEHLLDMFRKRYSIYNVHKAI